jgi:2-polyprenyl-3-methyl-5-hydroxy-6-metoxy-1,4-benzoquinol methylase
MTVSYKEILNLPADIPQNHKDVCFRTQYMKHFLPKKGVKILDLGAYMGANLIHYALLGHLCEGVEGASKYVERFHEEMEFQPALQNRVHMHHCLIEDFEPKPFDAVICGEVLEHSHDPEAIVQKAYDCLIPGGIAFFAVFATRLEPHVREYTAESLREEMWPFKSLRSISPPGYHTCQGIK